MRSRIGNPYDSPRAHRAHELVLPGRVDDPDALIAQLQAETGARFVGNDVTQEAYVNTSRRPDGSTFVAIVLREGVDLGAAELGKIESAIAPRGDLDAADVAAAVRALGWVEDTAGGKHPLNMAATLYAIERLAPEHEPALDVLSAGERAQLELMRRAYGGDPAARDELLRAAPTG